ncbi:MAG: SMC-Scp complex subunit ScpB [Planctomyces sp.]|nr:SMC-Scp complex subunit ScpB [Planctomyces sp.]
MWGGSRAGRVFQQRGDWEEPRSAAAGGEFLKALCRRRDHAVGATGGESPQRRSPKMARVEAALMVADSPLSARRIAQSAALVDAGEARRFIDALNELYDAGGSAFRVERVGAGFQMLTRPIFARWLDRLHQRQARLKLSAPALETLAVIAYRQPITRADIESVRGVQSAEILKQLMERNLVKIVGEDDSLGRPYLYGTTRQFLESYGLRNLDELPMGERLRSPATTKGLLKPAPAGEQEAADNAAAETAPAAG